MHACRPYRSLRPVSAAAFASCILISAPAAHAQVTLDGTLGPAGPLAGPDYAITDDLGQLRGANLFHSFGDFTINTGESATFTGPTTVENILGRVTGGSASLINGRLSSQIPGANLYLMNPSGLMFGPNATLDISGSFHATTADYISLADGGRFDATTPSNSVLTAAPPEAFGFLGNNPDSISVDRSAFQVPEDATLSLIGGDIQIQGDEAAGPSFLRAPSGRINVASVASPGEVIPNVPGEPADLTVTSERQGEIRLSARAGLNAGGDGGGTVVIRGGRFIADNALVFASATGPADGTLVDSPGSGIDIQAQTDVVLDNGMAMGTNVFNGVAHDSGGVRIRGNRVAVRNGADIQSNALGSSVSNDGTVVPPSAGRTGDVVINAGTVSVTEGGQIRANTGGLGDGGSVLIQSESLEVLEGGSILTLVFGGGSGNAGDIQVDASTVRLSSTPPFPFTAITSQTLDDGTTGAAGDVRITADSLQLTGSGFISSLTFNEAGPGGNVNVAAGDVLLSGSPENFTMGIFANTLGTGTGGRLRLSADNLELRTRSSLQARTLGPGNAGGATIDVSGTLSIAEGSFINTGSNFGTGDGADLAISAGRLSIVGAADSAVPFGFDFTGLSTATDDGRGGNLSITADSVELSNTASLRATSEGVGDAGSITLDVTGDVSVVNGAEITTFANDAGSAGAITIRADHMVVSGINVADVVDPETGESSPVLATTSVSTQAQSEIASAGDVSIEVGALEVLDGGRIQSRTLGKGAGGDIHIVADRVLVSDDNVLLGELLDNPVAGRSVITALADGFLFGVAATGDAGNITIEASDVEIVNKGALGANTTTPGTGGAIDISADRVTVSGDGRIRSVSERRAQAGDAGNIVITARELYQSDGGIVSSSAGGAGLDAKARGGSVSIAAGDVHLSNGAFVSARNNGGGDGGSVTLTVDGTFTNDSSTVTATALEGAGGGVAITAGRDIRLINGASVTAETSGPGDAGGVTLVAGDSIRLEGSTALTKASEADGGNIVLTAQDLVYLLDSEVTSSVGGGVTTVGGNITIDPRFVVLNKSDVRANAFEGQGGKILIVTDNFISSADSNITASSEFGVDGGVLIRSPEDTVIVGVEALPESFLNVSSLLSERCAARTEAKVGSFVVLGRGGVSPAPDSLQPSSYVDVAEGGQRHDSRNEADVQHSDLSLRSDRQSGTGLVPSMLILECGRPGT